jgi:hypothetical protein
MKTKKAENIFGKSKGQICLYRCLGDLVWPLPSRSTFLQKVEDNIKENIEFVSISGQH